MSLRTPGPRLAALAAGCVLVPSGLAAAAMLAPGLERTPPTQTQPPEQAFVVPPPVPRPAEPGAAWAPVLRAVTARVRPDDTSPRVAVVPRHTPEHTTNVVRLLRSRVGDRGRLWEEVALSALPNGQRGWVPREALGGRQVARWRLVVDSARFRLTLYRGTRVAMRAPVGVGAVGSPTPKGEFYVRNKLTRFRSALYGPVAFGTSARSAVLTDWPADGHIGIHGTNRPELIPGRVSHGCIRMRNRDIARLARMLPVGTPLVIT
jgi:lipoprotein-anchoring transpeptidase ErfK/SrfK